VQSSFEFSNDLGIGADNIFYARVPQNDINRVMEVVFKKGKIHEREGDVSPPRGSIVNDVKWRYVTSRLVDIHLRKSMHVRKNKILWE